MTRSPAEHQRRVGAWIFRLNLFSEHARFPTDSYDHYDGGAGVPWKALYAKLCKPGMLQCRFRSAVCD